MSFELIRKRLVEGRPLVLDSDTGASFRARGVLLSSPGTLGQLLRERPSEVASHYRAEIDSRVDVLSALTADTTPRALSEVGMEHRSAQLTGRAVELALEATQECGRPVAVPYNATEARDRRKRRGEFPRGFWGTKPARGRPLRR